MHEFRHEIVRRPPMSTRPRGCQLRLSLWPLGGPETYKRTAINPHPLITAPPSLLSSPFLSSIFTFYRGPGPLPSAAIARRPRRGVGLGDATIATTIHTVHTLIAAPPSLLSSPFLPSIFTFYRGPGPLPSVAIARRPRRGVGLEATTIRTVHSVTSPSTLPLSSPLHAMQDLYSTRKCRM
jgi:hypothetical protein